MIYGSPGAAESGGGSGPLQSGAATAQVLTLPALNCQQASSWSSFEITKMGRRAPAEREMVRAYDSLSGSHCRNSKTGTTSVRLITVLASTTPTAYRQGLARPRSEMRLCSRGDGNTYLCVATLSEEARKKEAMDCWAHMCTGQVRSGCSLVLRHLECKLLPEKDGRLSSRCSAR